MPRPSGPAYGSRVLELGMDGLDVWELQIKLVGWGSGSDNDGIGSLMDPVRLTGKLDATTRDAVRRFQKAHGLALTGVVDGPTFRAMDDEVQHHGIPFESLKCPCVSGKNDGPIPCRCGDHPDSDKCTGFGNKRFAGKYLLDGSSDASLRNEKLPVYAMEEHPGIDKTVLWAARALMHRAGVKRIRVTAGYRCWHDNYHSVDQTRWKHSRSVLHLGSSIEFIHSGKCEVSGSRPCAECERIRQVAVSKCGYQRRWIETDRVSVGDGRFDAAPPTEPFALHLDTIMLLNREAADFVKTDADAASPRTKMKTGGLSMPVDLGAGRDPLNGSISAFFDNIEEADGGQFPVGDGRLWHAGVHLTSKSGTPIHSMADGELVACRTGEPEDARAFGSRNFVLLKHDWKGRAFYTLFMHLDGGTAGAKATIGWRRTLYFRAKDHVELLQPGDVFRHEKAGSGELLVASAVPAGERVETTGDEVDARTLDPEFPPNSKVIKLDRPGEHYVYTNLEGKAVAKINKATEGLSAKLDSQEVIGLDEPIPVHAGEVIGNIAAAPTHESLKGLGAFVHVEAFAESAILSDPGYVTLDASDDDKVADRRELTKALVAAKLLINPPDGVLLEEDTKALAESADRAKFRSAVVKMKSPWAINWKNALAQSTTFGFMKDADRDAIAAQLLDYQWWAAAKTDAGDKMPADAPLFHYHPLALILQLAHAGESST